MALTTDELATIRAEIGDATPPTDVTLDAIFVRVESVAGVVREVLSKRLADLLARPTSFTIPGDYSESRAGQIEALQKKLAALGGSGVGGVSVKQFIRDQSGR